MKHNLHYSLSLVSALILLNQPARANNFTTKNHFTTFNRPIFPIRNLQDSIQIKGKVSDSTGTAISGAVITEKGTTNNALTESDGTFTISADPNGALIFLKSGYATQEVLVNNQTQIEATLLAAGDPRAAESNATDSSQNAATLPDSVVNTVPSSVPVVASDTSDIESTSGQSMITGIVSGPSGPLSEVTVSVQGTDRSTSTDQNGKFQLEAQ